MHEKNHIFLLKNKSGFTLIELAIVLLIIGLIAAGILAGKELIHIAMVQKQIKQVNDYTIAYNIFKDKYRCIPGDCANATNFFPDSDDGNGNSKLENSNVTDGALDFSADGEFDLEQKNFFTHLQSAELIRSDISLVGPGFPEVTLAPGQGFRAASIFQTASTLATHVNDFTSQSRDYFASGQWTVGLYFSIGQPNNVLGWGWENDIDGLFSPLAMYSIDVKLDDGFPNKGNLRAGTIEWTNQYDGKDGYCLDNAPHSNTVYTDVVSTFGGTIPFPDTTWDKYLISNTETPCIFAWRLE